MDLLFHDIIDKIGKLTLTDSNGRMAAEKLDAFKKNKKRKI